MGGSGSKASGAKSQESASAQGATAEQARPARSGGTARGLAADALRLQARAGNAAVAGLIGGAPLPAALRGDMERVFDEDLSSVRVDGAPGRSGVLGEASEERVRLAPVSPLAGPHAQRRLLAHELAHVLQHRRGAGGQPADTRVALEAEAARAGEAAVSGGAMRVVSAAAPGAVYLTALSDTVRYAPTKGAVFDALRAASERQRADPAVIAEARIRFGRQSDDLWLAERLITLGPEPLWPAAELAQRSGRAAAGHWAAEPGNIEAGLVDTDRDTGPNARLIRPITAYLFPGTDPDRRVLVIGGVHGSEPEGREVVERLRARLAQESAAGNPPAATTILVPELVGDTSQPFPYPHRSRRDQDRMLPRGVARTSPGLVDPNRNFPFPGTTYADARALGARTGHELETLPIVRDQQGHLTGVPDFSATPRAPRDVGGFTSSQRMLPETRVLIRLLERFQPQRIVSVHSHGLSATLGDAPGAFVDTRGFNPRTGRLDNSSPAALAAATAARDDDLALTRNLVNRARTLVGASSGVDATSRDRAFAGNLRPGDTTPRRVEYLSTRRGEGNSLGQYGPVATGARPAATTITVEVPQLRAGTALDQIITAHGQAIDDIVLR